MSQAADSDLDFDLNGDEDEDLDIRFQNAAHHVQMQHHKYAPITLLELYALYKQSTIGRCNIPKPGILQMQARSKWTVWHDLNDMSKTDAQLAYIKKVQQVDPDFRTIHEQQQQQQQKQQNSLQLGWVVHSIQQQPNDPDANKPESEKTAFDYVKELNLPRLRDILQLSDLQCHDANGMALIHWATDRNATEILRFLLDAGADVNQRDADQQTPLHYASSCGHVDVLRILIEYQADTTLRDIDGQTCHEVADNDEVREILNNN